MLFMACIVIHYEIFFLAFLQLMDYVVIHKLRVFTESKRSCGRARSNFQRGLFIEAVCQSNVILAGN